LLALGLLSPLGSLGVIAAMLMAILKAHWGKPSVASAGGMELPLTYLVVAFAVGLVGAGQFSLDALLGIALPMPLTFIVGLVAVLGGIAVAMATEVRQPVVSHQH
jgi:putative oxidoreductase